MQALNFLSPSEQANIHEAIERLEERTSAELVCAVATESGRYDRAESIVGLLGGLLGLGAANIIQGWSVAQSGSWSVVAGLAFGWQCLAVVIGFILGNVLASYAHPLRRLVTSQGEMAAEVMQAASFVFGQRNLTQSSARGGLLIYVSLYERRVAVLGDQGILQALGQDFLNKLRDLAVEELKAGRRDATFQKTIEAALKDLEQALPVQNDHKNELPNELVLIHPRP